MLYTDLRREEYLAPYYMYEEEIERLKREGWEYKGVYEDERGFVQRLWTRTVLDRPYVGLGILLLFCSLILIVLTKSSKAPRKRPLSQI